MLYLCTRKLDKTRSILADDNSEDIPISFRRNTEPILEPFTNPKNTTIMAKNTPIDIIKDVSSKFGGSNAKDCFATNKRRKHLNSCIILKGHLLGWVFKIHKIFMHNFEVILPSYSVTICTG